MRIGRLVKGRKKGYNKLPLIDEEEACCSPFLSSTLLLLPVHKLEGNLQQRLFTRFGGLYALQVL
jgi:hypothetical protein